MVYAQPEIHPGEWDAQNSIGFGDKMDHLISFWPLDLVIVSKKKKKKKRENLPNSGL